MVTVKYRRWYMTYIGFFFIFPISVIIENQRHYSDFVLFMLGMSILYAIYAFIHEFTIRMIFDEKGINKTFRFPYLKRLYRSCSVSYEEIEYITLQKDAYVKIRIYFKEGKQKHKIYLHDLYKNFFPALVLLMQNTKPEVFEDKAYEKLQKYIEKRRDSFMVKIDQTIGSVMFYLLDFLAFIYLIYFIRTYLLVLL